VLETRSNAEGKVAFRGFHGEYTVTAQSGGKTVKHSFHLQKSPLNAWNVQF